MLVNGILLVISQAENEKKKKQKETKTTIKNITKEILKKLRFYTNKANICFYSGKYCCAQLIALPVYLWSTDFI